MKTTAVTVLTMLGMAGASYFCFMNWIDFDTFTIDILLFVIWHSVSLGFISLLERR